MITSIHGIYFIFSLVAIYLVMSPYLSSEHAENLDVEDVLTDDKVLLYAEELEDLRSSYEMKLITEDEYAEQKRLLLQDATKVT